MSRPGLFGWRVLILNLAAFVCCSGKVFADDSAVHIAVAAARGSPAVVVLWSPDCLSCRLSLPEMGRFATLASERGFVFVTVVPADTFLAAREMVKERALPLRVESDNGKLDTATRRLLYNQPVAQAVDKNGKVVAQRVGVLGAWQLEELSAQAATTQN